jgi:hypothetical protein
LREKTDQGSSKIMTSAPTANVNKTPHEPSTLAAFLSYLVPGLGQIYQKRYGKGVLFMVSLLGMFMLGQAMGQWQNVYVPRDGGPGQRGRGNLVSSLVMRWHYIGQFWIGVAAWPALWHYFGPPPPPPGEEAESILSKYQRAPNETKVNEFLVDSDKTPDLGWVYTVVAGMLNILVMYDAYAGPIFLPVPKPAAKESSAPKTQAQKEGVA